MYALPSHHALVCVALASRPYMLCPHITRLPPRACMLDIGWATCSFTGYRASALSYLWRTLERADADSAVRCAAVATLADFHTDAAVPAMAVRSVGYDPTLQINRVVAFSMFEPIGADRVAAFLRDAKGERLCHCERFTSLSILEGFIHCHNSFLGACSPTVVVDTLAATKLSSRV
jgi:hypothetical protein